MLFLNSILLLGALGIAIPITIHLLNRRSSRIVEWGAMHFLLESLAIRNRRIQLEEALLMATRCLLVGLLALALARPFIPPGSTIPWLLVLPLLLLAVVGIGVAVVLHEEPKWRRRIAGISIGLLLACVALIAFEKYLNLSRFAPSARQDIALIIDSSTSMSLTRDGVTNFERAIEEARDLIQRAPRGHAFSLILGGPSPAGRILDPTTDRTALAAALDEIAPLDGAMSAYDAFTLASLSLARGDHPAKQIVILTDEQNVGWEIGRSGRWTFLREAFRNLPSEPQIMIRNMSPPDFIRNLAVTEVHLSRDIVGVDRAVHVTATVVNTGNEAVTPGALVLQVDGGGESRDTSLGQLRPGEEQTVTFTHQFGEPGAHALSLTLEVEDDIESDNTGVSAVNVADELRVLIVDGRPSRHAFDSASAFAAVALAPSALTLDPSLEANRASVSDEASDDFDQNYDPTRDSIRFLVAPQVVPIPDIATLSGFDEFDAVILADVPRLPSAVADSLADYISGGGGLLVAAGQKTQPDFYNGWQSVDKTPLLPASLGEIRIAPGDEAFSPSAQTLTHPALQKIAEVGKSDFADTVITNYRPQTIPDILVKESSVGARLNNGDILLTARQVGKGQVLLLGTPLDLSSGNLVTRQAFLPLIHELVYHLADPAAYQLNLDPAWEIHLGLTGKRDRSTDGERTASESELPRFAVKGPKDRLLSAQLDWREGDSVLKLQGEISSGLYRLTVPDEQAPLFADFLRKDHHEIPFTVKRDAAESRLVPLREDDFAFLANFVTISRPQTLEQLLGFLNGNQFGEELWKYLALGAFVFLLVEIVLSRWIARSRRMGEEIQIAFESKDAPTHAFREQLAKFAKK
ncbi:MAG: VWA domain-containing protein [Verrucomicrobiaceae bacterium]|nr:VWA domain-containing protein [Verrucomicrobiaceae bacterium]